MKMNLFDTPTYKMTSAQLNVVKAAIALKLDVLSDNDTNQNDYVEVMTLSGICNSAIWCCDVLSNENNKGEFLYDMPITDLLNEALKVYKEVLHDRVAEKVEAKTCTIDDVNDLVILTDLVAHADAVFNEFI